MSSYNTRKSGGGGNYQNRGRGAIHQNFMSGGQYHNNKPGPRQNQGGAQKNQLLQQQMPEPQQQQYKGAQQLQPLLQQANLQQNLLAQNQQNAAAPLKSAMKKPGGPQPGEVKPVPPPVQAKQEPVIVQNDQIPPPKQHPDQEAMDDDALLADGDTPGENGEAKKRHFFKGKISKKEKRGRRNKRLKKMLMPKNALMILNELCSGHKFVFVDKESQDQNSPFFVDADTYVASVTIDGVDHVGYGKSKIGAKTNAAENALKHIVLNKVNMKNITSPSGNESENDVKMEVEAPADGVPEEDDISWLHVASFAMHKLFSNWSVDNDNTSDSGSVGKLSRSNSCIVNQLKDSARVKPRKPAKTLPNNPLSLNPVMLLNQMRDDVFYEEAAKEGNPPNIIFTYKTDLDGYTFYGKAGNKKIARRNCAYAACAKLFNLTYPLEEFDPSTTSVEVKQGQQPNVGFVPQHV